MEDIPTINLFLMRSHFIAVQLGVLLFSKTLSSQEDLLSLVEQPQKKVYSTATFKTTRLINFHTVEVLGKRSLDFRISHRFGDVNSGPYNAWGIDGGANIRLAIEYSHNGRLMFGIGRTSDKKIADGFLKYKLVRQTVDGKTPVSITLFSGVYHTFLRERIDGFNKYQTISDRLSYCNQIIVAKKFNSSLSIQLLAAMVHFNIVESVKDQNNCYIAGIVARYKITTRQAVTVEYGYRLNKYSDKPYYDSFGLGYELETGGHVFQLHFTNSFGLTENQYFMYTNSSWKNWGIRLGFNISRVFGFKNKDE